MRMSGLSIVHMAVSQVPVLHEFGGAMQRRAVELAVRQRARGHTVRLYSTGPRTETIYHSGVEVRFIKPWTGMRIGLIELQVRAIWDLIREREAVDVMHFHGQPEGAVLARPLGALNLLSFDYFYFRRGLRGPVYQVYRRMIGAFDVLLPVSRFSQDGARVYWKLQGEDSLVLYNGVNTEQFRPDPAAGEAERNRLELSGPIVLYVGRVNEQKGTDTLLDAFRTVHDNLPEARLVVVGPIDQFGGGDRRDTPWPARIEAAGGLYLGAIEEERLAGIYNMADVFVMPTKEHEMFGMAAAEAQACGKPVVASDHGGLTEVVPPECGGRFPVGDSRRLADLVLSLLANPDRRAAAASFSLANAQRFAWSVIEERLEAIVIERLHLTRVGSTGREV